MPDRNAIPSRVADRVRSWIVRFRMWLAGVIYPGTFVRVRGDHYATSNGAWPKDAKCARCQTRWEDCNRLPCASYYGHLVMPEPRPHHA